MSINLLQVQFQSSRPRRVLSRLFPSADRALLSRVTPDILNQFFFQSLERLAVRELIECGAREAMASETASKMGIRTLAIEANPQTFETITSKVSPEVKTVNVGIGGQAGELVFYVPKQNSIAGNATFRPKRNVEYVKVPVATRPLDELCDEYGFGQVPFGLWVDVEGSQRDLIAGGQDTLASPLCAIVKIELENQEFFRGQDLAETIDEKMRAFGFIPVFCDFEFAHQFNVVYVRKLLIDSISTELSTAHQKVQRLGLGLLGVAHWQVTLSREAVGKIIKNFLLTVLGVRLGNIMAALLGSQSSKQLRVE